MVQENQWQVAQYTLTRMEFRGGGELNWKVFTVNSWVAGSFVTSGDLGGSCSDIVE
jgi:hypothetical protein